jgi:hypothetical protein
MVASMMMRAGALNRPSATLRVSDESRSGPALTGVGASIARASISSVSIALAAMAACGCSIIDPGDDPQIAPVVFEDDFFYCQVQPNVLVPQSCASGDPAKDSGGCHATTTTFRLLPLGPNDAVKCDANGKHTGGVSQVASNNYGAAQIEMKPNAEEAPLLTHPTQKTTHPRLIFDTNSTEADIIRQWALHSSR